MVSNARAEEAAPPPLRALGGWPSAEWFCMSVLLDEGVVGFTLPKVDGGRKQNFRIVERALAQAPGKPRPAAPPTRKAVGLPQILDEAGALDAAAFRRTTFLFEAAPVLFFARLRLSGLKIRAANALRVRLVESGHRACVLHLEGPHATVMFWPGAEMEITAFVTAAGPPYPLHAQFDLADEDLRLAAGGRRQALKGQDRAASAAGGKLHVNRGSKDGQSAGGAEREQERRLLRHANAALLREIATLRTQVEELRQSQSALGAMEALGLDDARLKSMLRLLHPDKHANSEAANDAAKWINNLRDLLRAKPG